MIPVLLVLLKCSYLVKIIYLTKFLSSIFYLGPPLFGLSRPPFFPQAFLSHPPPNPFIMHPRFPISTPGPHGMMSPISHIITNGNDLTSSEIIDSSNLIPNSTNYDTQSNENVISPVPDSKSFQNIYDR